MIPLMKRSKTENVPRVLEVRIVDALWVGIMPGNAGVCLEL